MTLKTVKTYNVYLTWETAVSELYELAKEEIGENGGKNV